MKKRFLAALSLMLVAMMGAACAGTDEATTASAGLDASMETGERRRVKAASGMSGTSEGLVADEAGSGGDGSVYGPAQRDTGLPDLGLSVIKTATVSLEVGDGDLQATLQDATTTAEKYGGFVVSTTVREASDRPTGTVVIRIPAARFGDALSDLESMGKVASENISGQDVSQEFIDLQARLRNYVAQETVLLKLMKQAQNVLDTIRVQNELQRVQLEIERLRGRITYLEDQTAMSTIEVRLAEEGVAAGAPGEFEKAWERAKDGLVAVVAGLISSLGVVVPLALLALLVGLVIARLRPRVTNG